MYPMKVDDAPPKLLLLLKGKKESLACSNFSDLRYIQDMRG